ncbi:MAG: hypothetical protein ACJ747_04905 [Gaiellaceae bacterium]|nr:hypothetical protein [Acidobacteriota bacterium]
MSCQDETSTQMGRGDLRCGVRDRTLVSASPQHLSISFDDTFAYVGGQRWDLLGLADAEQHLFVCPAQRGTIERLYWIQFEEFLPDNTHTYDYARDRTVDVAGLEFIHDTRSYSDFARRNSEPGSDGAYARKLLAAHGYGLPGAAMRTRLIHLPTSDRRSELMIIYLRAVETPLANDGALVNDAAPEARCMLREALEGMSVTRPAARP